MYRSCMGRLQAYDWGRGWSHNHRRLKDNQVKVRLMEENWEHWGTNCGEGMLHVSDLTGLQRQMPFPGPLQ